jgi:hypothetical protein
MPADTNQQGEVYINTVRHPAEDDSPKAPGRGLAPDPSQMANNTAFQMTLTITDFDF